MESVDVEPGLAVDVRVRLRWRDLGEVQVDVGGKLSFGRLEPTPGLYRLTLTEPGNRTRIYVGETDNLRRRAGNYRNPGPSQQTSQRINRILLDHLGRGGQVRLAIATAATAWIQSEQAELDMSRKASRLLAENAALVALRTAGAVELVNL